MSIARSDSLFSPEGVVLRDPAEVERALLKMWKPAGEAATGGAGTTAATRVSVANLVLVAPAWDWDHLLDVLAELSPMYPTRTIALLIADGQATPAEIKASVSALCHVPQAGDPQVCCEQIVLLAGVRHIDALDQTLLPLLESDVPVMSWWRLEPRQAPGLFAAVQALSNRLILDAGPEGFEHLEQAGRCAFRELGWYRTYPWRELIAQMFDECGPQALEEIEHVSITTRGSSADERIDAAWLAAFLAGQLEWQPVASRMIDGDPETQGTQAATFEFRSRAGAVEVVIAHGAGPACGLSGLAAKSGHSTFEAQCYPGRVEEYCITTCDESVCQMPRGVQVAAMRRSQALASALTGRRVDAAFERARAIAAWMISHRE